MTNNMTHPILELLNNVNMNDWLAPHNLESYGAIHDALVLDGKPVKIVGEPLEGLENPISSSAELVEDQLKVIDALVSGWILGVMQPLMNDLNKATDGDALYLNYDGDLQQAVMNFDDMEDFIAGVGSQSISGIKDLLSDWSNTCKFIENMDVFLSLLDAHALTATDTSPTGAYDVLFEIRTGDNVLHNEVRVTHAISEEQAIEFALYSESVGDEDDIASQMALIKSGETDCVKNFDEDLSYKPALVIPLQEVPVQVMIGGVLVDKTVLLPCEDINAFNGSRYYKH